MKSWQQHQFILLIVALIAIVGCTRQHYRVRADQDAYARVFEKSAATPWMPPANYNVYPAPNSRLRDHTPIEDPCLPIPSPQLYGYQLPPLAPRDTSRFKQYQNPDGQDPEAEDSNLDFDATESDEMLLPTEELPPTEEPLPPIPSSETRAAQPPSPPIRLPSVSDDLTTSTPRSVFAHVSYRPEAQRLAQLPAVDSEQDDLAPLTPMANGSLPPEPKTSSDENNNTADENGAEVEKSSRFRFDDSPRTTQVPLPKSYWEVIPPDCLTRMFEFETVRAEYAASFGSPPDADMLDDSPKLALEDIVEITLLNSRELQSQKEQLYRAALALTLERFDYQLKPSVGNNGTAVDFTHNRSAGITENGLRIPTTLQLEKMLYTGGDFLGRFANSVLLTFNGPQGFAVDVGSELLFSLSQSLLQRDVRLENLTQSERNVVYAARDFARFRKELFVQQSSDYYSLIRQFRQIEIDCQNYFTLSREFNQRSIEIKFGFAARTELDQVEQNVIRARQSILSTCTSLENSLDALKIRMGIPTEQPLNLDLSELDLLTLRDELAVNAEIIERTRNRVSLDIQSESRSAFVIVGTLNRLVKQMLDSIELRERLGDSPPEAEPLEELSLRLRLEASDIDISEPRDELVKALTEAAPVSITVIQRRRDIIVELLKKVNWQIQLLHRWEDDANVNDARREELQQFVDRLEELEDNFKALAAKLIDAATSAQARSEGAAAESITNDDVEAQLVREAEILQSDVESIATKYDRLVGRSDVASADFEQRALEFANDLLQQSERFRETAGGGLIPIQIEMDDAMLTALVQRFDLMNQRGFLADDWRQIKYAADDLRSVLNLQAAQSIRTRNGINKPFDFSFDDSTTSVGVTLDLPFNRRSQRNRYRTSLFDYQSTLRSVMQLEDTIKLSVRRDLRQLTLDRQQYSNDIAAAALASGRVTGTEAEVRSGFATSRDFLESQFAYVQAVSSVASRHINYIVARLQLFLDLESLTVGDDGFWPELYDENYQPQPYYELPGYEPAYGQLHPKLKYSPRIQRMRCVPNGHVMIHQPQDTNDLANEPVSEDSPTE